MEQQFYSQFQPPQQQQQQQYGNNAHPSANLNLTLISSFNKVWDDTKTGAHPHDVTFFRPTPAENTFLLGDVIERGHVSTPSQVRTNFSISEVRQKVLLAAPLDVELLWNNKKTGGSYGEVSIWKMVPPSGYVALGCLVNNSHVSKPDYRNYVCVHESAVIPTHYIFEEDGTSLWSTKGTGTSAWNPTGWFGSAPKDGTGPDCTLWRVCGNQGLFSLSSRWTKPFAQAYTLPAFEQSNHQGVADFNSSKQQQNVQVDPSIYQQQGGQMITPAISIVPYKIDAKQAEAKFHEWRKSLWFAPTGLTGGSDDSVHAVVVPKFMPHLIYAANVSSNFNIQVCSVHTEVHHHHGGHHHHGHHHHGHHHHGHHHGGHDHFKTYTNYGSHSGTRTHRYQGADFMKHVAVTHISPVSASTAHATSTSPSVLRSNSTSGIPVKALSGVDKGWNLSEAKIGMTDASAVETTGLMDWSTVFSKFVTPKIIAAERRCLEDEALAKMMGPGSKSVTSSNIQTTILTVEPQIVYLPIYVVQYEHAGEKFYVFINGQTGLLAKGEKRPHGMGFVGGIFGSIGVFGQSDEQVGVVTGKLLNEKDGKDGLHEADKSYLMFPGSGKMGNQTGYVKLKNEGDADLELVSVKRRSKGEVGGSYLLRAGEERLFEYLGHWTIKIESGEPGDLRVLELERHGGGPKGAANNHLCMM